MQVHGEKGILATTVRDVAERAGVSPATVLNHFPRLEQLVQACGELTQTLFPFPAPAIFEGCASLPARLERLVQAVFGFYGQGMGDIYPVLQVERRQLPILDGFLRQQEEQHRQLVVQALAPLKAPERACAVLLALTDYGAFQSLRRSGLSTPEAAAQMADVAHGWLQRELRARQAPARALTRRKGAPRGNSAG
jgi:AcrR family transcriptional regulator